MKHSNISPHIGHFTGLEHLHFGIDIGITNGKLFTAQQAVLMAYPLKMLSVFPELNTFTSSLQSYMENLLRKECPSISHKAKCIYYSGIGQKIYKTAPTVIFEDGRLTPCGNILTDVRTKPGFTPVEYARIRTLLLEVHDLLQHYEIQLHMAYPHDQEPGKLCNNLKTSISRTANKLEKLLKKRHGGDNTIFFQPTPDRNFLDNSLLSDIAPYWSIIREYLQSLFRDEYKKHIKIMYCEALQRKVLYNQISS